MSRPLTPAEEAVCSQVSATAIQLEQTKRAAIATLAERHPALEHIRQSANALRAAADTFEEYAAAGGAIA